MYTNLASIAKDHILLQCGEEFENLVVGIGFNGDPDDQLAAWRYPCQIWDLKRLILHHSFNVCALFWKVFQGVLALAVVSLCNDGVGVKLRIPFWLIYNISIYMYKYEKRKHTGLYIILFASSQ